jgi:hypothetical protein
MAIASVKASWEGDVERLRLIVRTPHAATVVAALQDGGSSNDRAFPGVRSTDK